MFLKISRQVILAGVLLLPVSLSGQQEKSSRYRFGNDLNNASFVNNGSNLEIRYSIGELDFSSVTNNSGTFFRLSSPGHSKTTEQGKPELPVFSRLITIPEGSSVTFSVSEVKTSRIKPSSLNYKGLLYPRQADATKNDQLRTDFIIDKKVYSSKGVINSDTVKIEYLGKIRNNTIAAVYIYPVRYNPGKSQIEVISSMKVTINFTGQVNTAGKGYSSVAFDQSLGKGILNYFPEGYITGYSDKPVGLVIVTDTAFSRILKPFIAWKKQEGFSVTTIYRNNWAAGSTYIGIKDSLTKIYRSGTETNPAPEYLLIVGSTDIIPLCDGTSQVSDMYYGEFDGNGDYLPDMYIGRLPVADTSELKGVVNKLLQYERFQFADTNKFYNRAVVTGGNDGGYAVYMNGQVNYAARNYLNSSHGIDGFPFLYPRSATADDTIKKLINTGVGFVNYTGHGDISGWIDPVLKAADVPLLQNRNMYPFVVTNACQTAHFNYAASLGNKMINEADKGAIGYIGCSNDSYWDEDYFWSVGVGSISDDPAYETTGLGAYDRLFHFHDENPSDWYITMGQMNYAGNMSVSASSSNRKKYYWETYTLLGDPSLVPFIGKPDSFNLHLPDKYPNGIKLLSFITEPFAHIAISRGDSLLDATYASPDGSAQLNIPGYTNDSCLLVVTGQNRIPLIRMLHFGNIGGEFINLGAATVNDSTGNLNGRMDYNESFYLSLNIENLGLIVADSLSARITTPSSLVKILSDSVFIGSLAGRSSADLPRAFRMKVADSVPDRQVIAFDLILKDKKVEKRFRLDIMVHAPDLRIISCYIDDTGVGNGNFIPEPGETVNLIFKIGNNGSSPATGTFVIDCQEPDIAVVPPGAKSGIIPAQQTITYILPVTFSESVKLGKYFTIRSAIKSDPYSQESNFEFRVGKARENFEVKSFNIFPWMNSTSKPWTITGNDAWDGLYSARSGQITHNQSSSLKMKVYFNSPDSIRFHCKVSSEQYYDFLTFKINNEVIFRLSGESGWVKESIMIPQGLSVLEWIYNKDEAVTSGSDCAYLDLIDFPDPSNIVFIQKDISVDRVIKPVQNGTFLTDSVTVVVTNRGKDPVNGFNLAYSVNGDAEGYQHFNISLNNYLDSARVSFTGKPDLSRYDIYDISVYSMNNDDDYLLNDTARTKVENVKILDPFRAFPNPFTDVFKVIINSKNSDEVIISLTNSLGVVVKSLKKTVIEGENSIEIDCSGLAPGFYYLTVKGQIIGNRTPVIKLK